MAGKDIVMATAEELRRLHVIRKTMDRIMTQKEAEGLIDLSVRQIRRIAKRIKDEGDSGVVHKSRGLESNRKLPCKEKVLKLFEKKYSDFGPTLASEKLFEIDKIKVSDETLRLWLIQDSIPYPSRKKRAHRQWRERKHHVGEMVQIDGSHHDWFEGRAPECVLMGYIDDASGQPYGRFYSYEGVIPAMDSFKRYINRHRIPQSVYIDRHSTYKSKRQPSVEEELNNYKPMTQFERALEELGVKVIHALSPQAKGRIERLFRTFQDRLIKEMRIRGISGMEEGNKFLKYYMPVYGKRFCVKPFKEEDLHRPIPKHVKVNDIFCIKTERVLRKDFTVMHEGKLYQVKEMTGAKKVIVIERLNGRIEIHYRGKRLKYRIIAKRPEKAKEPRFMFQKRVPTVPSKEHPWRKFKINIYQPNQPKEKAAIKDQERLLKAA